MAVTLEQKDKVLFAYLEGELDHHTAAKIREDIDAAVDAGQPDVLMLDFRDITFMDSSGIGLVMGRYKKLKEIPGAELHIVNTSPGIGKVMRLAGMERLAIMDKNR